MKKFSFIMALLAISMSGVAQDIDNFEVGPYEVDYKGPSDYKYRLRKDIDLYEYYGLKKDTVVLEKQQPSALLKSGFQLEAYMEACLCNKSRHSSVYGMSGAWKQSVGDGLFLNGGLSVGMAVSTIGIMKYNVLEVGVPLSVELASVSREKASLYGGIGVTPTYYSTMSTKYEPRIQGSEPEDYSGLSIVPKLEFGGYVPCGSQVVKVGVFLKYKINCSKKDIDLYKDYLGKSFLGANIGIVF